MQSVWVKGLRRIGGGGDQADIFNLIQNNSQNTSSSVHLKVIDEEPKSSTCRGPQQRSEMEVGRERTHTCQNATTRLVYNTATLSHLTKASRMA